MAKVKDIYFQRTHLYVRFTRAKEEESGHNWLGSMLSAAGSKHATLDTDYHLRSASRAFFVNKSIFLSRNVSIKYKLKFFDAIVTPIAGFGAGPRCVHSLDMVQLDIDFRRMIRCVVGAPSTICWRDPWHEIRHIWNQFVRDMVDAAHIKTWAENCVFQHRQFACYIMSLPHERWAGRMLQWQPLGRGPVGRPAIRWASTFEQFSRIKHWYDWKDVAANRTNGWEKWRFFQVVYSVAVFFSHLSSHWFAPKEGCLVGMRTSDIRLHTSDLSIYKNIL